MPDRYLYLYLDVFTISAPFLLSFDKKVAFWKNWKFLFPSLLVVSLAYLIWDVWFTEVGIWKFNYRYLTGPSLFGLPLEEYGFFLVVPYSCLFIYCVWKAYFPKWNISTGITYYAMTFITMATAVFNWQELYTQVTFGLISLTLLAYRLIPKIWSKIQTYWSFLFTAWLIAIIPMLYVNGELTIRPILIYNNTENLGIRILSIPLEDFFYNFLYMLWMVPLYEYFRRKSILPNG